MSPDVSLQMNAQYAAAFASLALSHVTREYPNKLDHVLLSDDDARTPQALHPIFYGSFDWHSCVHGYWLLAHLYRTYPALPQAAAIRDLFNEHLTAGNVAVEVDYAAHPARAGFERPYGWAWTLKLCAELSANQSEEGRVWAKALQPLGQLFAQRFVAFLPKATYPIRTGTHFNTAFAVSIALEYATAYADAQLGDVLRSAAIRWYGNDTNAPAWEPGGDDFLSGTLMEAECMRRVLAADAFSDWIAAFLPSLNSTLPGALFSPAVVSDRTDGKIAHLDGLNLSRAWCWRGLASHFPMADTRREIAHTAANAHLTASLLHVAGDYMGEHWLATFALLALGSAE